MTDENSNGIVPPVLISSEDEAKLGEEWLKDFVESIEDTNSPRDTIIDVEKPNSPGNIVNNNLDDKVDDPISPRDTVIDAEYAEYIVAPGDTIVDKVDDETFVSGELSIDHKIDYWFVPDNAKPIELSPKTILDEMFERDMDIYERESKTRTPWREMGYFFAGISASAVVFSLTLYHHDSYIKAHSQPQITDIIDENNPCVYRGSSKKNDDEKLECSPIGSSKTTYRFKCPVSRWDFNSKDYAKTIADRFGSLYEGCYTDSKYVYHIKPNAHGKFVRVKSDLRLSESFVEVRARKK